MLASVMGEGKRSFLRAAEEESAVQEYEMTGDPFTTILTDAARAGVNAALVVWPAPAEADGEEEGGAGRSDFYRKSQTFFRKKSDMFRRKSDFFLKSRTFSWNSQFFS